MNSIVVNNLSKSYDGKKYALKNVSFSIPKGEVFGFLGPNGSGKTTTVRLLNEILTPTSGSASILGYDLNKNSTKIHSLCGVMTETAASYENMSGMENLKFFGNMYGLTEKEIDKRSRELLKSLDLYEFKDKKVKTYSTGMKKKISLARALLHEPEILFLDEPTSGLDPEAAVNVTNMIRELSKQRGVTVFLCTHQLKYAEDICTLYGFIHQGELLGFGTFNELLKKKNSSVYLEVRGVNIPQIRGMECISQDKVRISVENDEEVSNILYKILSGGGRIYEAKQVHWSLEDLYFSYGKEI